MAFNQTIEAPNYERIDKESGPFTADAVSLLWQALNDTRASLRRLTREASEKLAPKMITLSPTASVDNLDSQGASIIAFSGGTQNFTGIRAPQTAENRVMIVINYGAGTITTVHEATSEAANQLSNASGANVALATRGAIIYAYVNAKWREVA